MILLEDLKLGDGKRLDWGRRLLAGFQVCHSKRTELRGSIYVAR